MKIKKLFSNENLVKGLSLDSDNVIITMNGEEFVDLMNALGIASLRNVDFAEKIYEKLSKTEVECEWID